MKLTQPIPLLALTLGCNSILGIDAHQVSPGAGGLGNGGLSNLGNAGQGPGVSAGTKANAGAGGVLMNSAGQHQGTAGAAPDGGATTMNLGGTGGGSGNSAAVGASAQVGGANGTEPINTSVGGSPATTNASGGAPVGGAANGGAATGGATTSAPPACTGSTKRTCGGACVDISDSTAHCGRCDHDCGGGACTVGVCQPMQIYTAPLPVTSIAVSTSEVYFATNDDTNYVAKLFACPKEGCVLAPRQLATMKWGISPLAWVPDATGSSGTVVFESAPSQSTIRPALYPCPDTGCPATPTAVVSDGLGSFERKFVVIGGKVFYSSDHQQLNVLTCSAGSCTNGTSLGVGKFRPFTSNGTTSYFIDSYDTANGHNGYILGCDLSATPPCTPTTVSANNYSSSLDLQLVGSMLYWLSAGRDDFNEGKISSCVLPGCSTVSDIAKGLNSPTEMLADSTGIYVIDKAGKIQRCTNTTCSGGIQDWTSGTSPRYLASDANFVYWAEGTVVRRIAK